jgi:hypothetical protein
LEHSFFSEVVHERPGLGAKSAADYGEILADRSVGKKLLHQRVSIGIRLRKQQGAGGKTIDTMHDQGLLPLAAEFFDE